MTTEVYDTRAVGPTPEERVSPRDVAHVATLSLLNLPNEAAGLPDRLQVGLAPNFCPSSRYETAEDLARTAVLAGTMAVANVAVLDIVTTNLQAGELPLLGPEGCYVVEAKKPGEDMLVPQYESLGPQDSFMSASLWLFMCARESVVDAFQGQRPYPDYHHVWELSAKARESIPAEKVCPGQLQMPVTTISPSEIAPDRFRDSISQQLRFVMDHVVAVTRQHPGASVDTLQAEIIKSIPAAEVAAGYPLEIARAFMGADDDASRKRRCGQEAQIIDTAGGPRYRGLEKIYDHTMCSAQTRHLMPEWSHAPELYISLIGWHIHIASEVARHTLWRDLK